MALVNKWVVSILRICGAERKESCLRESLKGQARIKSAKNLSRFALYCGVARRRGRRIINESFGIICGKIGIRVLDCVVHKQVNIYP